MNDILFVSFYPKEVISQTKKLQYLKVQNIITIKSANQEKKTLLECLPLNKDVVEGFHKGEITNEGIKEKIINIEE